MESESASITQIMDVQIEEGGAKNKVQDTIPNFEELIESITNMLLFFAGVCGGKGMRCQSLGGGGGLCLK